MSSKAGFTHIYEDFPAAGGEMVFTGGSFSGVVRRLDPKGKWSALRLQAGTWTSLGEFDEKDDAADFLVTSIVIDSGR